MLFGRRYFGLQGTRLQIAVGALAGLDFMYVLLVCDVSFAMGEGATADLVTT